MDLLALFAPERCVSCRTPGADLCACCLSSIDLLTGPRCRSCGNRTVIDVDRCNECRGRRFAFATARAAIALDGTGAVLVRAWKDRGLRRLADRCAGLVVAVVPRPACDALVVVPSNGDRARWRGTDGPSAVAERLGVLWELPVLRPLIRVGDRPQRGLDRAERRRNARTQFRWVDGMRAPGTVGLVDDVYTTGATVDVCARLLRQAGAGRVEVVTFARAVRS